MGRVMVCVQSLILLAVGCEFHMPPKPLSMHIASDVSEVDATAYRDAALRWNRALGVTAIRETDTPGPCGVRVVRGDDLDRTGHLGRTAGVRDCVVSTMLRASWMDDYSRSDTAAHELGHALLTATDDDHNTARASVMHEGSLDGHAITMADIERVRAALPEELASRVAPAPER